jgi:hypothetical protein
MFGFVLAVARQLKKIRRKLSTGHEMCTMNRSDFIAGLLGLQGDVIENG